MSFEELINEQLTEVVRNVFKEYIDLLTIPEFLTPEQIAKKTQVDEETVRRWCRSGQLPYTKLGKAMRIEPKDFRTYCLRNKISQ